MICVARTASFVQQVAKEIEATDGTALAVAADVTSRRDCERIAAAEQRFGRLDGVVNSAFAAGVIGVFADVDLDASRSRPANRSTSAP